jgi:ATP-dependent Clp protease protease subunit
MLHKTTFSHNIIRGKTEESLWHPRWITVGDFTDNLFTSFCEGFNTVLAQPQDIIPIIIDSNGGYVDSLMGMLDMVKVSPKPVATIVESKANSCGAVLLSAGHKGYRFASPNSTILIHEVSSGTEGTATEISNHFRETDKINEKLMTILAMNSNKPKSFYKDLIRGNSNTDLYLSAKEAKKYGLVDHVKVPTLFMDVKVSYQLS